MEGPGKQRRRFGGLERRKFSKIDGTIGGWFATWFPFALIRSSHKFPRVLTDPDGDCVCLVSSFIQPKDIIAQFLQTAVDRCSRGTLLSPLIRGNTLELKVGPSHTLRSAARDVVLITSTK